jgi:hypothetical protein
VTEWVQRAGIDVEVAFELDRATVRPLSWRQRASDELKMPLPSPLITVPKTMTNFVDPGL